MRKLRQNITVLEFSEYANKAGLTFSSRQQLFEKLVVSMGKSTCHVWPESFYERPPPRSYGKFVSESGLERIWGHLREPDTTSQGTPFICEENGVYYAHFTPGLPADVDENGWPK